MAYVADTFVAGEQPTTSKWNELWGNDASFNDGTGIGAGAIKNAAIGTGELHADKVYDPYKFSIYLNSAQNSTNGTSKINFDTALFDTGSNCDLTTNHRFTAPIAGFYFFAYGIQQGGGTASTTWQAHLYKNGATTNMVSGSDAIGSFTVSNGSGLIQLAASDYVEVYLQAASVVAINTGTNSTYLHGFLVSGT